MATHEILTACRGFFTSLHFSSFFFFYFNYVSAAGGTFICVSSGEAITRPAFCMFLDDTHQPLEYPSSFFVQNENEGDIASVFTFTHPGYVVIWRSWM